MEFSDFFSLLLAQPSGYEVRVGVFKGMRRPRSREYVRFMGVHISSVCLRFEAIIYCRPKGIIRTLQIFQSRLIEEIVWQNVTWNALHWDIPISHHLTPI
jgi:hypothetical protein